MTASRPQELSRPVIDVRSGVPAEARADRGAEAPLVRSAAASPSGARLGADASRAAGVVWSSEVAVLLVADVAPGSMLWGWSRLVRGPLALAAVPGLRFAKILGSGHEGRFGLRPSSTLTALFLTFDDAAAADRFLAASPEAAAYRRHAREWCSLSLRAWSSRGSWSGTSFGVSGPAPADGPVVALTRASIRPSRALRFWRQAPPAQRSLSDAPGCRFAIGLGEAPLLRQATISLWDSVAAMDAYARSGAHLDAIRAAHRDHYFSESMFVRFVPLAIHGNWQGRAIG